MLFGLVALDSTGATTLMGLELGRAVVDGMLTRAGRDVATCSGDEHRRAEAESLITRAHGDGDRDEPSEEPGSTPYVVLRHEIRSSMPSSDG